ncbi:YybH family protein [Sphaerimonospora sp. CA-214678]|uniref:YybH family protein n=1 Tax=Sphaerimonospora sp. CA-214678 TaxID=3240029 RepID=UPI003D9175BE
MNTAVQAAESMLNAVVARDLEKVVGIFSDRPDAYMYVEGPRWTTRGGERLREGWAAYFRAGVGIEAWEWVEGPFSFDTAELAQVMGVIDYRVRGGDTVTPLRLRMTWLFRMENGRWRIVHEHGSQPLEDPYGAGDWWPEGRTGLDRG